MITDSPAKRAPCTGTRVIRSKQDVRSPHKASSGASFGSSGGSADDKKRRPYTTPSRPTYETKRDPNTPTRTIRPYRPNTGGRDRLMSPPDSQGAPGMLTVVPDDEPLGVMAKGEYMDEEVDDTEIEWVVEEGASAAAAAPPPPPPAAAHAPSPKPKQLVQPSPAAQLDATLASHQPQPVSFGKDGSKVRTGSKTLIGKGSFGCVFKGLHEGTNQIVAIKEVHLSGESAGKVNMIKKEIQLMKRLNHPNIVRYLGAERVKTQLHIYLEYVTGGSMASVVKEYGPLTEDMTRKYSRQILDGLHYLHTNKIVHRDIKGDNLLVGTDGTVKLADFGTSKELRTLAATVTGTACFMAPEVIKGVGHGLASDVWSLGCAIIEMLKGRPPFSSFQNQYATMMHVAGLQSTESEIPDDVEDAARQFLRSCLKVEPEERATSAELLRSQWFLSHPEDLAAVPNGSSNAHLVPINTPQGDAFLQSAPQAGGGGAAARAPPKMQPLDEPLEPAPVGGGDDSDVDSVRISHTDEVEECVADFNPMESYVENL